MTRLVVSAGALAEQADGAAAAGQAGRIAELFAAHAARENDVLLPALLANSDVDLAGLLAQMHRVQKEMKAAPAGGANGRDPQAALLGLLLEAARALARSGQRDLACRLHRGGVGPAARGPAGSCGDGDPGAARAGPTGGWRCCQGRFAGRPRRCGRAGTRPGRPRPGTGAAPRDDLRGPPRPRARRRLRARQRPRSQAAALPVPGGTCRAVQLGLPGGRPGGVAGAHRPTASERMLTRQHGT